jgi:hypothetical protein
VIPVGSSGEPGQDALRWIETGGRLERAGQDPGVRDAVESKGPVLADPRTGARDVPVARMGDEPVRVQGPLAAPTGGRGAPDLDWPVKAMDPSTASSLPASRPGRTRRIFAAAVSLALPVAVISPVRRPTTSPSSTAGASSSVSMSGGKRYPGASRYPP